MDYAGRSLVKPMIVVLSSRQVWEGSADTELLLIGRNPNPLFSFSGFLPTVSHDPEALSPVALKIYTGDQAQQIHKTMLARTEKPVISEFHSFRRIIPSDKLLHRIAEWLFTVEEVVEF
jgi:hypothetical protein